MDTSVEILDTSNHIQCRPHPREIKIVDLLLGNFLMRLAQTAH